MHHARTPAHDPQLPRTNGQETTAGQKCFAFKLAYIYSGAQYPYRKNKGKPSLQCRRFFGAQYGSWIVTGCLTVRGLVQRRDKGWGGGKYIFFLPLLLPPCPFSPLNPYSLGEYLLAPILQSYWIQHGGLIRLYCRLRNFFSCMVIMASGIARSRVHTTTMASRARWRLYSS